jgi:hypothetical protein
MRRCQKATSVQVYMRDSDIQGAYTVIGAASAMDLGKYQMLGIQEAFPTRQRKGLQMGRNAVVVDNDEPVESGIFSTEYSVYGRAIRLDVPLTAPRAESEAGVVGRPDMLRK